jgi:rRNA maturation RNase YbeY
VQELELAGEIYISVADAVKQAREFKTNWQEEVARYVVHGILHLRGYDDLSADKRKVMKREENRLMRRMQQRFDLRKVAR